MITSVIAALLLIAHGPAAMAQQASGTRGSEVVSILVIAAVMVLVIGLAVVGIRRSVRQKHDIVKPARQGSATKPLLAVLLALVLPGSGHLYLGHPFGIVILVAFILLIGLAVFAATNAFSLYPELTVPAISLIAGALWIGQALDCYKRSFRR